MSLREWKEKFYPVSAGIAANEGDLNAIIHSLNKWEGLRKSVLGEYELSSYRYDLSDSEGCWFDIDNGTCALCRLTYTNCTSCPIFKSSGDNCINAFEIWLDFQNPEPMINLLKQTLSWYLCKYNKGEIYEN